MSNHAHVNVLILIWYRVLIAKNRLVKSPMDYIKIASAGLVTVGAATVYYFLQSPETPELAVDLNDQTQNTDGVRMSRMCTDNKLISIYDDNIATVYDAFQNGLKESGDKPCLGYKPSPDKPYTWITYREVSQRVAHLGSGLVQLGLEPQNKTCVGVYSQNRPEYIIIDQAIIRHSMTGVPLYDTLGVDACNFIINQAELTTIFCDNNDKVSSLLDRRKQFPCLKTIIIIDQMNEKNRNKAAEEGVRLLQLEDVENLGKENPVAPTPPKPNDLYMICYTSGTTGTPKGAMLSHRNIIAVFAAAQEFLKNCGSKIYQDDVLISYLPLAHSYERVIEALILAVGARIGFFQGDIKKLMDDLKELQPTLFPTVPRLLNRFYDKVLTGVNSSKVKKFLFNMALKSKTKDLKRGIIRNDTIWDKFIFRSVQQALGGRVRIITTGSAPISSTVLSFLRCIVGCPILEGYGQTENAAVSTLTVLGDPEPGHVGPPLPCNMVKLCDVPEMNYFARDNKGEICIKGPNVFLGYLKDEEKTREALDEEDWLHTGDIGAWTPNGTLKVIDRKKNIFKLSQGEYIAPEKIENIFAQSPYVAQVYVHGDSLQAFLVGIIVPDAETLPNLCTKLGVSGSPKELAQSPAVKDAILKDLIELGKQQGLSSLEMVKDIYLHPDLFSVENGLLTPTFKTKRQDVQKFFAKEIESMYDRATENIRS
ncbi:long-chain-fatty-acid--CoA ligase 5-like isoform X2 [Biomphalaria glabrata]|uniref:Long-chain-fatty-acid--CoA ligase n=2 Tax=Biomphalaria glabrata TaxID=6526 RepID=A0A9W2ZPU2_BIOGL|nr:long-chain-fatty-acid--CoA ligase 5-like isoform X2 [Biomphalaria glabrata]